MTAKKPVLTEDRVRQLAADVIMASIKHHAPLIEVLVQRKLAELDSEFFAQLKELHQKLRDDLARAHRDTDRANATVAAVRRDLRVKEEETRRLRLRITKLQKEIDDLRAAGDTLDVRPTAHYDPESMTRPDSLGTQAHLDMIHFPHRIEYALRSSGCITIADVLNKTEAELLRLPNFGRKSLNDLRTYLGVALGKPVQFRSLKR